MIDPMVVNIRFIHLLIPKKLFKRYSDPAQGYNTSKDCISPATTTIRREKREKKIMTTNRRVKTSSICI